MSGFFGCVSRQECVSDVFYGTDYHSHLGTKRAGMAFYNGKKFIRSIHSLENGYFRNKFEDELPKFGESQMGIGVISDCESQPITITSHLGRYAVVTVARIENIEELTEKMLSQRMHFAELSSSDINATELVAMLIGMGNSIKEGIEYVQNNVKGSCSMLVLTDHAIYAARDKFGRTPISIGKNDKGYVCASESSSYANLGYSYVRDLGPGEIVQMSADGVREVTPAGCRKQICSFLWVYYGYPSAWYEESTSRMHDTRVVLQWPDTTQNWKLTMPQVSPIQVLDTLSVMLTKRELLTRDLSSSTLLLGQEVLCPKIRR